MDDAVKVTAAPVVDGVRQEAAGYRDEQGQDRPLGGYLAVMGVFCALVVGASGLVWARGRRLPDGLSPWDAVVLTLGTTSCLGH